MKPKKVVALAGGTGSAKLLRGLARLGDGLSVVTNVGDNFWFHGLYVCPDVDIATYALAGVSEKSRGWGLEGDTFQAMKQLSDMGEPDWFRLGDRDMAVCSFRTGLLRSGETLTRTTELVGRGLGLKSAVLPATDSPIETHVLTPKGDLHLQEFWVREKGRPRVLGVEVKGAGKARITEEVRRAVEEADRVVFCPANPVTSIGPIIAVGGMRDLLSGARDRAVAVSPMIGTRPFSGPARKLMRAIGVKADSEGVAGMYRGFIRTLLVSSEDKAIAPKIESLGVGCLATDISLASDASAARVAQEVLSA